jgi:diguanylate cyclase (GGDEF)-like protein
MKDKIGSYIKEIKQLLQEDILFFLATVEELNNYKRSRLKIISAMRVLYTHPLFDKFVLEFYMKTNTNKFRSVALIGDNPKLKKYSTIRLFKKNVCNGGYLTSNDFSKESKMRSRFIEDMNITRSTYFPVSTYGMLVVSVINGGNQLSKYDINFIKLYLKIVIVSAVEIAIDNEKNFSVAIHDPLTNVYNKGYFLLQLKKECANLRGGGTLSLIMIDFDNFKKVNDTYGHPVGDKLLKINSNIFVHGVRKYDTVARYGGEEFAIILPKADINVAKMRAEELRKAVYEFDHRIKEFANEYKPSISLGVSNIPYNTSNEQELIDFADKALYVSKRSGKNMVSVVEKDL